MADPVLMQQLGGALVQLVSPLPALTSQAAQVTAKANASLDLLTADYQLGKKILLGGAIAGGLFLAWKYARGHKPAKRPVRARRGKKSALPSLVADQALRGGVYTGAGLLVGGVIQKLRGAAA